MPITAKLVADLMSTAGAHRILTMDLHVGQIQGFFDIPVDNLYASPIMIPYIQENFQDDLAIVSPDAGGVPRARAYAKRLAATLGLIDKRRDAPGKAKAMNLIGEVLGKEVVIMDDIIDTGGTLSEAARVIHAAGRPQRQRLLHPRGALRPGGAAGHGLPPEPPGGHRHHSLERRGPNSARRSSSSRWPTSWPRPSSASTRRIPSARCSRFSFKAGNCRGTACCAPCCFQASFWRLLYLAGFVGADPGVRPFGFGAQASRLCW